MFLFNFAVDFVILSLTVGIARVSVKTYRLVLGAAIGAAGACGIFFVPPVLSVILKTVTVAVSGIAVFGKRKAAQYLKLFLLLFCVSFAFGGGVYALCSVFGVTRGASGYMEIDLWLFVLIFAVLYLPIKLAYQIYNRKMATSKKVVPALITLAGRHFALNLLSDTGSTLKEPISGRYVMLVDGAELFDAIEAEKKRGAVVVPYMSAGNPNGVLVGVFAKSVTASGRTLSKTVVAHVGHPLSQSGEFNAVISSEAFLHI